MRTIFCVEHDGSVMTKAVKIAIFPLRLLLFYIVYNGGKSGSVRLSRVHQPSLSGKKGKPLCKR